MRKLLLYLLATAPLFAFAQTSDTVANFYKPHISGSADVYYRYNADAPAGSLNNFTKFTNTQNAFALGMASVKVVDTFEKVSGVVNLGFGPRANEYNYVEANNSILAAIKEMYVSYAATSNLKFTVGKWYKHLGYEIADAYANPNYSMSYTFSYSPMSYTGVKAEAQIAKRINLMVGLTNPADVTNITYSPTKAIIAGAQFAVWKDKIKVKLGYQGYGGVSTPHLIAQGYYLYKKLNQYDVLIEYAVTPKLNLVYNGTILKIDMGSTKNLNSTVAYVTYAWSAKISTTLRGENLRDIDGVRIGTKVNAATLTGNFTANRRLRFIPEIRVDNSVDRIFQKANASSTKTTVTGLLAAVYSFGK